MISDTQTQRDLELFEARDGGLSVFVAIDRTHTRQGRRRLREMLDRPLAESADIRARQEAVRHLHRSGFHFSVSEERLDRVWDYVESNFTTLSAGGRLKGFVESGWILLRYRELLRHAGDGIVELRKLIAEVRRLLPSLAGPDVPTGLARLRDDLDGRVEGIDRGRFRTADSAHELLVLDRDLRGHRLDDVEELLRLVAELDALASAARVLDEGYVLAETVEDAGPVLEGEGLWHPFLPGGRPNPVSLRGGQTLVFLTGPNMAGKTTYLKAVGLCVYLAQCGLPVPAGRFAFAPVDRFVTGLSPEDNLREGISYFLAEVRRVKDVLTSVSSGRRTIAIFDEVFRGTNVSDALEASKAVLVGCSRARRSTFIFSSHLVELADELEGIDAVEFRHFDGELDGDDLRFDYRIRSGVSRKRFGMELLRREGVPELLAAIPPPSVA